MHTPWLKYEHVMCIIITLPNRKRVITLRRQGYGLREILRRLNEEGTVVSVGSLQPVRQLIASEIMVKYRITITYVANHALVYTSKHYLHIRS